MTDRDYIFTTKSRKTGLAIATIILTVLTAIFGFKNAGAFFEKLSEYGLKPALTEYVPILILAGAAVLFSLFFLFSSWRASRISRKKMIKLAEQAEEAKAKGIEFRLPERSASAKVGSAISKVLDAVTKVLILLLVIGIAASSGYISLKAKEFDQRPVFDVLEAVDITDCVVGYDGLAYVDPEKVIYNLPEDITEIYQTSPNYKEGRDYTEQQELWTKFLEDLKYTIDPDPTKAGNLSNDDVVSVTATLPEYDVPKFQADVGVKLEGLDLSKEAVVAGLPYKYSDEDKLLAEKIEVINAAFDKLKMESYKEFESFRSSALSGFTFDAAYLCKPEHNEGLNPDGLLLLAHTDVDPSTEYSSAHTMAIYVAPFDSRTEADDVKAENTYSNDQVAAKVEFFKYSTPDKVKASFETGIYFSADTGYVLTEIPWTEPVAE